MRKYFGIWFERRTPRGWRICVPLTPRYRAKRLVKFGGPAWAHGNYQWMLTFGLFPDWPDRVDRLRCSWGLAEMALCDGSGWFEELSEDDDVGR